MCNKRSDMIAIKTILFILALFVTLSLIEDAIEKIIMHNKTDGDELHVLYTSGLLSTFDITLSVLSCVLWTGFYLINQF